VKLSNSSQYAILAILQLAESKTGDPVSSRELAEFSAMPKRFLLQILRNLVIHEIVDSTRGVIGGYRLRRPLAEISLVDLIEAVDGPIEGSVPRKMGVPEYTSAVLRKTVNRIAAVGRNTLGEITLADLLPG
jgi:Rrf2 family protein